MLPFKGWLELLLRWDYKLTSSVEASRISRCCLTSDDEVGLSLEVLGGEFDLSSFIQLDVSQSQAVDFTLRLQHHLSGSTE